MRTNRNVSPAYRGSLYYLAYWSAIAVYSPFINLYFARLGLSGSQIGLLSALLPLMTLTVAPALSALADRRGWRVRILALALLGLGAALALLALPRSFGPIALLMALLAFVRSPVSPIGDTLVARMAARHRLNYGAMRLWGSLGFAVVAIAGGALWQYLGFRLMFPLATMLFVPVALGATLLEEGPLVERGARRPLREVGRDRGLIALLCATYVVGAALGMDSAFESVYVGHLGGGGLLVGVLFGVSAFSELPTMGYAAAIARRLGAPATLLLAYGMLALNYTGFALARDPLLLVPLTVVKGFGFGLYFVSGKRSENRGIAPEGSATSSRGVFERNNAGGSGADFGRLRKGGVDVLEDGNCYILYHKVIVIDERTLITGWYNCASSAERDNDDKLVIVDDRNLAHAYLES